MKEAFLYVLDTHVLIWYFTGNKRLRQKLKDLIEEIRRQDGILLIPTIVLAEALDIAEKHRVEYDFNEMYRLIQEEPEFEIVGFSSEVFEEIIHTIGIKEIHDRIIVATAKFYGAGILTKDRIIQNSGEAEALY
jgi:predicted nucleic acid-binding protein